MAISKEWNTLEDVAMYSRVTGTTLKWIDYETSSQSVLFIIFLWTFDSLDRILLFPSFPSLLSLWDPFRFMLPLAVKIQNAKAAF